ncbi:MAG TPA: flavin reductase family protein [Microbacterium sp.]|jgi:flavin reductase (DIM6/NTAB) family NADH-FMN oxidoreductase RutF|nr:flavin reductase family protein [Microbacterium sp.]
MSLTQAAPQLQFAAAISARDRYLRASLERFATGVVVVTAELAEGRAAIMLHAFTPVSLDPPLLLIAVEKSSPVACALRERPFAINVLGAEQGDIARRVTEARGGDLGWVTGESAPRLRGALAHFECLPWATFDCGDRLLHVGRVEDYDDRPGDALGFVQGRYVVVPEYFLNAGEAY